MALNLKKRESLNLTKSNGQSLRRVRMELSWSPIRQKSSGGFLSKLFGSSEEQTINVDMDASALIFGAGKQLIETVYFGNLKNRDRTVVHSGDNLTGEGDGPDEIIRVNIDELASNVESIFFTVNSFRGHTFDMLQDCSCQIVDDETNQVLGSIVLTEQGSFTAMVVAKLYKEGGVWKVQHIGDRADGRTAAALVGICQNVA